jgi:predicted kinase
MKAKEPNEIFRAATPEVHLVEGPVGAGKSTFAAALAPRLEGVHLALDAWFARLFSPDRPEGNFVPWYLERKDRLLDLIWDHSRSILGAGTDVILELGLIQRQRRMEFCQRIRDDGFGLVVYVLDAPREVRRERVRRRNIDKGPTFSIVVPDHVFDVASSLWEPPDEVEQCESKIRFVSETLAAEDAIGTRRTESQQ